MRQSHFFAAIRIAKVNLPTTASSFPFGTLEMEGLRRHFCAVLQEIAQSLFFPLSFSIAMTGQNSTRPKRGGETIPYNF